MDAGVECPVVVIGGSAGSIKALSAILEKLPSGLGVAIAIALHLPRKGCSALSQRLDGVCALPVEFASADCQLEAGHIVLAPPNYHLLVERGGPLSLSIDAPVLHSRPSIDVLFESAAEALGSRLIGLVLSGGNSDGSSGLRRIRECGGQVWVQDPDSAEFPFMPSFALERVRADLVGSTEVLAEKLIELGRAS